MKKLLLTFGLLMCGFVVDASAQITITQEQANRISAALAESKAKDAVIKAQDEQIATMAQLIETQKALVAQQEQTLKAKEEVIVRLTAMKCSKSQFLIFLYRTKRCS